MQIKEFVFIYVNYIYIKLGNNNLQATTAEQMLWNNIVAWLDYQKLYEHYASSIVRS